MVNSITVPIVPLRFEEKFHQHLNLDDGSKLAELLSDPRTLTVVAGLMQAFLSQPTGQAAGVLEQQQDRGRRRKEAIPRAVDVLIKAASRYRDLQGLELIDSALAERMEQEAFRLMLQLNQWEEFHNDRRLGNKPWIFLVMLEDFVKLSCESQGKPYQLTISDLLRLQTAGERAMGLHLNTEVERLPVPDDLRGLQHFRDNPRNQRLCALANRYALDLASTLDRRPYLIFRNEI